MRHKEHDTRYETCDTRNTIRSTLHAIPPPFPLTPYIHASDDCPDSDNSAAVSVVFENVMFSYPTRPTETVLNGLTLSVPRGSTVAVVGESGCGKSTIVSLIERFYDPTAGRVLIDGVDTRDLECRRLRRRIGVVSQEPLLFSGTILENILYGVEEGGTLEEAIEAAKIANAHEFVMRFSNGYDTVCGERGVALSGGQKQRIAIARAIIKKPVLLLCDEATAALDNKSEEAVQRALDTFLERNGGRTTTVVVAHRLRTIRNADFIAVVKEGRVAEWGSHDDLVGIDGGLYNQMLASG